MARVSDNWDVESLHNYSTILSYSFIFRLMDQCRKLSLTSFAGVEEDEEDYEVTSQPIKFTSYKYLITDFSKSEN